MATSFCPRVTRSDGDEHCRSPSQSSRIHEPDFVAEPDASDCLQPSSIKRSMESKSHKARGSGRGRPSAKALLAVSARSTRSLEKFLIGASGASKTVSTETPSAAVSSGTNTRMKEVRSQEANTFRQKHAVQDATDLENSKSQPVSQGNATVLVLPSVKKPSKRGRPRRLFSTSQVEDSRNAQQLLSSTIDDASIPHLHSPSSQAYTSPVSKLLTKKRFAFKLPLDFKSRAALVELCRSEIASLVRFYHEDGKLALTIENGNVCGGNGAIRRARIALLLEESQLPFSTLVEQIFEKLRIRGNQNEAGDLTLASVRSTVLSIAERLCFGVTKADADILEDDSDSCLWCWEVRDVKLLPEAHRDTIAIRRRRRRKIAERLSALSVVMSVLVREDVEETNQLLSKAEEALAKTDDEDAIRVAVTGWLEKQDSKRRANETKIKEKDSIREQQRLNRESVKERRRLDREAEKTRLLQEKERKRQEKEASKEQARAHKEASRQEKDLRRQQEEADKEFKRREKEAAEFKKQAALQKQATIMGRFLQSKKDPLNSSPELDAKDVCQTTPCGLVREEVVASMDREMVECNDKKLEELLSSHTAGWRKLHRQYNSGRQCWGLRRLPKVSVSRELRLQRTSGESASSENFLKHDDVQHSGNKRPRQDSEDEELKLDKLEMDWEESGCVATNECFFPEARSDADRDLHSQSKRRKLLQFDKAYRPAYYGTFSKKSDVIKPRNPLKKDPTLDYENDSDEEWEEEDPGESLSDCDKDEEDDKVDIEDDDENADGFVVPDGYLSENEGVHLEDAGSDEENDLSACEASTLPAVSEGILDSQSIGGSEQDLRVLERQQKLLENVTEQALRCNRAFVISNLAQDFPTSVMSRTERLCLQALRIHIVTPDIVIEPPIEDSQQEKPTLDGRQCPRLKKGSPQLPDSLLSEMVDVLLSSPQGLNKTIDILSRRFPSAPKSQLRSKIREVAEFVDNHWQVKKDIVEQLGLKIPCSSASFMADGAPKSHAIHLKPITKFFSKRCLPPEEARISGREKLSSCTYERWNE